MEDLNWIQSVQRALNYIESHLLEDDLNNERVAKYAYSSNANFQRIFSIVTGGITVADYIRSRKLTLAGIELAGSDDKVIDIALKYGYNMPENFTKAFTRFHGVTPSEAKRNPENLKCFYPIFLRIEIQGGFNMSTKIIPNIIPVASSGFGENYHFNGTARYIMSCLGEMKFADYSLFAGITGDTFAQIYPLNDKAKGDSAFDYYSGLRGFVDVFDKVGYEAEAFSERELQ